MAIHIRCMQLHHFHVRKRHQRQFCPFERLQTSYHMLEAQIEKTTIEQSTIGRVKNQQISFHDWSGKQSFLLDSQEGQYITVCVLDK